MNCSTAAGTFTSNDNSFGLFAIDVRARADPGSRITDIRAWVLPKMLENAVSITKIRDLVDLRSPRIVKKAFHFNNNSNAFQMSFNKA